MNENNFYTSVHTFHNYVYVGFDEKEKWKTIYNSEGKPTKYKISNYGRIKNKKTGKILKQTHRRDDNHHMISLRLLGVPHEKAKNYSVHRLVAQYFIPNPENKPQVHHIDGDPNKNYYKNLQWVTASEHMHLSYVLEQRDRKYGSKSVNARYSEAQYMQLGKLLEENKLKVSKLSKITGISVPAILTFIRGETVWPSVRKKYDITRYTKSYMIKAERMERTFDLISSNTKTINEISKETGVSRTTISDIINGKISEKWKYLLDIYDVSNFTNYSKPMPIKLFNKI